MTHSENAEPGWYPDPHRPGELRYWDGQSWTDHFHKPESRGGVLDSVGDWMSDTFRIVGSHGIPVVAALFVGTLLSFVLMFFAMSDPGLSLEVVDGELVGDGVVDSGAVLKLVLALVVGWLIFLATALGAIRHLTAAHAGRPISITESMTGGMKKLPRLIGYYLVAVIVAIVASVIIGLVLAVLGTVHSALIALGLIGGIALAIFVAVKFVFLPNAVAVSPAGTNAFTESMDLSRGRFWAVLGRVLLIVVLSLIASLILQSILGAILGQSIGADVAPGEDFSFDELFPSGGAVFLASLAMAIPQAAVSVVAMSAIAKLYLDAGGATEV